MTQTSGKIRVAIMNPGGNKKTIVEVPANVPVQRLIPALVKRLNFPERGADGESIEYRMTHQVDGEERELLSNQTLSQAGVQPDDVLRLFAQMRGGRRLFETAARY